MYVEFHFVMSLVSNVCIHIQGQGITCSSDGEVVEFNVTRRPSAMFVHPVSGFSQYNAMYICMYACIARYLSCIILLAMSVHTYLVM